MIRLTLAAILLLTGVLSSTATAVTTLSGRMPGSGRCLLTSPETFLCTFDGTFTGRLDGVQRTGKWRLAFGVKEQTVDFAVLDEPGAILKLVLPATAGKPRVVVTATGARGGTIAARDDGGFDVSLPLTSQGDQPELTVSGRFGPTTGAATTRALLPARFSLGTVAGAQTAHSSRATTGSRAGVTTPGHGATVFTGTGAGKGECAVMSAALTVCAWRGTLAGKLLGTDREGRFALQVGLHRSAPAGVEPPPFNPKEITIDKVVWHFAPTESKPGRTFVIIGGTGTVTMPSEDTLAFSSTTQPFADGLILDIVAKVRWGADGLKATGNEVAMESLEIVHEGFGLSGGRW